MPIVNKHIKILTTQCVGTHKVPIQRVCPNLSTNILNCFDESQKKFICEIILEEIIVLFFYHSKQKIKKT